MSDDTNESETDDESSLARSTIDMVVEGVGAVLMALFDGV